MNNSDEFSCQSPTVPPGAVFVAAGEALLVFPSVAAAIGSLEAIDVVEGLYPVAYGPRGEPYCLSCEANAVTIERVGESSRPDALKVLLLRHLEACEDPADATQPLADIVAIAWSIERDFRLRNEPSGDRFGARIPIWGGVALVLGLGAIWYFGYR